MSNKTPKQLSLGNTIPFIAFLVWFFATSAVMAQDIEKKEKTKTESKPEARKIRLSCGSNIKNGNLKPLYVIDGKKVTEAFFSQLDTEKIESVQVMKDEAAVAQYGEEARNGVILIELKKDVLAKKTGEDYIGIEPQSKTKIYISEKEANYYTHPSYIVNGKEQPANFDVASLNPAEIESVEVFKGDAAIEKYGERAKSGVVDIKMK